VYEIQLKQAKANVKNAQLQLAKMTLGSRPVEIATAQAAVQLARAALEDVSKIDDNELTKAAANIARAQSALRKAQSDYDKIAWAGDVGETREALALEEATIAYENALASYNLDTTPGDARLAPLMVQVAQAELNLALTLQPFREIDFAIAKAGIEQAEVGIEMAQLQLDNTVIEAPFDGIVAELNIAKGSNVGPQVPIARFVTQAVEVKVNVEESRIGLVKPGQFAAIRVPAFPGKDFAAVVTTISPVANKDTRTFSITVMPQDDEGVLRGGMFANVSLLIDEKDDTILTPLTSITLTDNDKVVYVVTAEQTVVQRTIVTGIQDNERIEILSGLEEGDTVVVAGQPNLIDGALVEVVNEG
jgi:multidrug efflux pump subunit AcrA (membrane-fusion protein)